MKKIALTLTLALALIVSAGSVFAHGPTSGANIGNSPVAEITTAMNPMQIEDYLKRGPVKFAGNCQALHMEGVAQIWVKNGQVLANICEDGLEPAETSTLYSEGNLYVVVEKAEVTSGVLEVKKSTLKIPVPPQAVQGTKVLVLFSKTAHP